MKHIADFMRARRRLTPKGVFCWFEINKQRFVLSFNMTVARNKSDNSTCKLFMT